LNDGNHDESHDGKCVEGAKIDDGGFWGLRREMLEVEVELAENFEGSCEMAEEMTEV